jgi:DNA-directed RNA polymerase I subunit RPA43
VAVQARATGQLWAALSTEERAVYQNIAAEEREQFAKEWAILKEKGLLPDADAPASSLVGLVLPVARVRKICKLDPDVRGMSKESLLLVTKSAELFTQCLGTESVRVAQLQNRRKLLPEDVAQVCSSRDPFLFLREDIKDLLREQQQQQQHQQTSSKTSQSTNHSKTTTADHIMAGSRSLTSYFGSTSSGAAATSTTTTD